MSSNLNNTTGLPETTPADGSVDPTRDIAAALQRHALNSTADFVMRHMEAATGLDGRFPVLDYALSKRSVPDGLICEFGVADGHTLRYMAGHTAQRVHGFDSFKGLPERWRDGCEAGTFACGVPEMPINVQLHQGWFADSIPAFRAAYPAPLALLHIDCDLYSSTRTVLTMLNAQIVAGTVIVFDEFFNYPFWERHEARAWKQFVRQELKPRGLKFEYLCYSKTGEQVALQVRQVVGLAD